ncbi:MAG: hypothetical protein A2X54_09725 [Nitrospirae bacterium GWF2_44_13]|nr:MAG: hypothetical protein A2X54_09725 [Nitrospirae bacterium GWF2_44_13]OGW33749.1 MAG: hypothetical protein A2088_01655 [Nitrospirae bacterium GWD2_44_7]OGW63460.1 MAG: hypothetical protein A2222_06495 [Nitrospirae bacterium RIFOXYA2_FULL_44_9]OGW71155.1 MAG: hypothetical protein A2484_03955 [Nitrospirae bacterium RIFOXYC2_FULL_44_7]HBG91989.1 hypothetical protein [Nitrospiraceae bacterium]
MTIIWFLILGIIVFFVFKLLLPSIFHTIKTAHVRKDHELWLMYVKVNEIWRALKDNFNNSSSYRTCAAAVIFAALEKCVEDYNIPRNKLTEIAPYVLEPFFQKRNDRQKIIDYYLHGNVSSAFHQSVLHVKEYLQGKPYSERVLHDLSITSWDITGV